MRPAHGQMPMRVGPGPAFVGRGAAPGLGHQYLGAVLQSPVVPARPGASLVCLLGGLLWGLVALLLSAWLCLLLRSSSRGPGPPLAARFLQHCPAALPTSGAACALGGEGCPFDWRQCPGTTGKENGAFTSFASCSGGSWSITQVEMHCRKSETPECPKAAPTSGKACSGTFTCDYNWYQCPDTEDSGEGGFTTQASCDGGRWLLAMTWPHCERMGGQVATSCPKAAPAMGGPCIGSLICEYDWYQCPGTTGEDSGAFTTLASCKKGTWSVTMANPHCQGIQGPTCPEGVPLLGGACDGSLTCDYNWYQCPGTEDGEDGFWTTRAFCTDGKWVIAMADILCPSATPGCPNIAPASGAVCSGGMDCAYDWYQCPGTTGEENGAFTTIASCSKGSWAISQANVHCGGAEGARCPEVVPVTGDGCVGSMSCDYNWYQCPGTEDRSQGVFTTFASCDNDRWVVATAKVNCKELLGTPCPQVTPIDGTTCSGSTQCEYDWQQCAGTASKEAGAFTSFASCKAGTWHVAMAEINCGGGSKSSSCPEDAPSSGKACSGSASCDYDWQQCPGTNGREGGAFTSLATCESGRWLVATAQPNCG